MSMHDYSDYTDDLKPGQNLLARISGLAQDQLKAELAVEQAQKDLEDKQAALKKISEVDLPELMAEAKMAKCTTMDGIEVSIVEKIRGSIPKATEAEAFAWLKEHNSDNLIKREFKIEFGKDEEAWAKKFQADLDKRKKKLKVVLKRAVHPSTLASYLSEQLEAGVAVPLRTFGCFVQKASKLKVQD